MSISPVCETSIFLWEFLLENLGVKILTRFNNLLCNGPKHTAGKMLENLPSSLANFRNSSWRTLWYNCIIFWEWVIKPRYSIDLAETNIDLSLWTTNSKLSRRVTISLIFLSHSTKFLPNVIKSFLINPATVTSCNLSKERGGFRNFVNLRGPEQRPFRKLVNW